MGDEEYWLVHHNERFSTSSQIDVSMIFIFATVDTSLKLSCTSRLGSRFDSQPITADINVAWLPTSSDHVATAKDFDLMDSG